MSIKWNKIRGENPNNPTKEGCYLITIEVTDPLRHIVRSCFWRDDKWYVEGKNYTLSSYPGHHLPIAWADLPDPFEYPEQI